MALREEILLDIRAAEQQLARLESQLSSLNRTITVPVDVSGEQAVAELRQEINQASRPIDIPVDDGEVFSAEAEIQKLRRELGLVDDSAREAQTGMRQLGTEVDRTAQTGITRFGQLRASLGPLLAGAAAGFGLHALVDQFNSAIESATALGESVNAVQVIFGEGAQTVLDFGRNASTSVGLAASQFNQLVTPIGALLKNFDLDGRAAADAAVELTQRASDLASVFNTSVQDALDAIGAALRGEQEPIRRYGVALSEAQVQQRALADGLAATASALTPAEKGQARLALLLEQSAFAAGDFNRTSDQLANRQRILAARLEDTRAKIGEALLPVMEQLVGVVESDLLPTLENLIPAFRAAGTQVGRIIDQLLPFVEIAGAAATAAGTLADALDQIPVIGGPLGAAFEAITAPLKLGTDSFKELQSIISKGFSVEGLQEELDRVAQKAKDSGDSVGALEQEIRLLNQQGRTSGQFLRELAEAAGVSDTQLYNLTQRLIDQRDTLNLDNNEVQRLNDLLDELARSGIFQRGGLDSADAALLNLAGGFQELNSAASDLATSGADRALVNLATGIDSITESSGVLPEVITNISQLRAAAQNAGTDVAGFLADIPDDVVINFDQTETNITNLLTQLDTLKGQLSELNIGGIKPEIDKGTTKEELLQQLQDITFTQADFEVDLTKIAVKAPNLAEIFKQAGADAAGALAESFAEDPAAAQRAEELLTGTASDLADFVAQQFGDFLQTATPAEIAAAGVFAADNLNSQAVRNQLADTAASVSQDLLDFITQELDGATISPNLIIDLSAVTLSQSTLPNFGGTGLGGGSAGGPVNQNVEVTINNPTTQDLGTSTTQAAQTISSVSRQLQGGGGIS